MCGCGFQVHAFLLGTSVLTEWTIEAGGKGASWLTVSESRAQRMPRLPPATSCCVQDTGGDAAGDPEFCS